MSLVIAALFTFAALRLRWLTARPIPALLGHAAVIFVVMKHMVMHFSAWHRVNHFAPAGLIEYLPVVLLFGLIVASRTRGCLGRPTGFGRGPGGAESRA